MQELNEFDIISKMEVKKLIQEFEEQNSTISENEEIKSNYDSSENETIEQSF